MKLAAGIVDGEPRLLLVSGDTLRPVGGVSPAEFYSHPHRHLDQVEALAEEPIARLGEAKLLPPVPRPGKIVGVGRNYASHAREMGGEPPSEPELFLKAPSALVGHMEPIVVPPYIEKPDYEGEIVLVVGRRLRHASPGEAAEAILGYTAGNDVTARDFQFDQKRPWSLAKSLDTFAPLGPYVEIVDDPSRLEDLCLETRLNGEKMQHGCVQDMTLPPARLLAYISSLMTLHPGDLVYSGTPPGVGHARSPPRYLRHGDVVEVRVTGLDPLRNPVVRKTG